MRIERIEIDGFGRFRDAAWGLGDGITVLRGANEAGKTTLLNALRSLLFGFDSVREGRPSYPALAGGRRGGRLVLRTADGARWVVERHGERGGAGTLAVRAPNGNQGGQETLDRLLHGADRDLFAAIFAFGLGELQTFASLSADRVRARIYGAGAGLGGTSAVDLERRLRAEMDAIHLPRGQRPLNLLLGEIEGLRARIADLERQPEEYERANRDRDEQRARADTLRAAIHANRERSARVARLADAAPVVAELSVVEAELAVGDPGLDDLPVDAVPVLDRRLAAVAAAVGRLEELDEALRDARASRAELMPDAAVLAVSDEIGALEAELAARAGIEERRAELRAAESRHAAVVSEQLRRAGGWEELRLLGLDGSIPALEAIRGHEEALRGSRTSAADTIQRHRLEADELERRRTEMGLGDGAPDDEALADRETLLQAHDALRPHLAAAAFAAHRSTPPVPAWAVAAALAVVLLGVVAGAVLDAVFAGVLGVVAAALLVAGTWAFRRQDGDSRTTLASLETQRGELLQRLGLPAGADDDAVRRLADETARARARRDVGAEQAAAIVARQADLERWSRAAEQAAAAEEAANLAWRAWLTEGGFPEALSPEGARELLAVADTARRAADERDRQRQLLADLDREDTAFAARVDALFTRLGVPGAANPARRDSVLAGIVARLREATQARTRAQELDAAIARLAERRDPMAAAEEEATAAVAAHLAALGCPDGDTLRHRAAQAEARRAVAARGRELRERLAGIAGSVEAIGPLVDAARDVDLPALSAERADLAAELEHLEREEREALNAIGGLDARIADLETADELGMRRQELAVAEGRAHALARRWTVRALALRLLSETRSRYERDRQPDVVRAAEAYFERITDGRYPRIVAPPGEASVRVETEGGETRATEQLSRGTAEQLYLALRFGLIEEFARQAEPLPVVMDDILVNFDADRASRAAAAIRELAERHQVLYFTCHAWTADLLDPTGARTVELEAAATIA